MVGRHGSWWSGPKPQLLEVEPASGAEAPGSQMLLHQLEVGLKDIDSVAKLPEKFLFAVFVQLVESIVVLVRDFSPARDDDAIRLTLGADDVEGKAPRWRPVYRGASQPWGPPAQPGDSAGRPSLPRPGTARPGAGLGAVGCLGGFLGDKFLIVPARQGVSPDLQTCRGLVSAIRCAHRTRGQMQE